MKITYPREKRKIRLARDMAPFYVLLGRGRGSEWWLMNFWDKPYMFTRYKDAQIGAKKIESCMKLYEWEDGKCIIAKVTL